MKKISLLNVIFILGLILQSCGSQNVEGVKTIEEKEFKTLAKDKNTVILDVRTREEIISEGYIQGASLFIDFTKPDFEEQLGKLDKSKNYLVYCKSGGRSSSATEIMAQKGFKAVYNLEGGISNWSGTIGK